MKYTTNPPYNAMVFYRNKVVWLGTYLGNFEVIFGQDNEYYESLYTGVTVHTNMRQALILKFCGPITVKNSCSASTFQGTSINKWLSCYNNLKLG